MLEINTLEKTPSEPDDSRYHVGCWRQVILFWNLRF